VERIAREQKQESLKAKRQKKLGVNKETEARVEQYNKWAAENLA
jgi:hypothetical protein